MRAQPARPPAFCLNGPLCVTLFVPLCICDMFIQTTYCQASQQIFKTCSRIRSAYANQFMHVCHIELRCVCTCKNTNISRVSRTTLKPLFLGTYRGMYIYNVLLHATMWYHTFDIFSQTASQISFKFCVDVPLSWL